MGGHGGTSNDSRDLRATIDKIKSKDRDGLSEYHKELLRWYRNVDKRYAWVVLLSMCAIGGSITGSRRVYGLIFARVTKDGIYTRAEASWPMSMVITTENVCGPIASIITYRVGYRGAFFIGGLLVALGSGLTALSESFLMDVFLYGIVNGFGCSFTLIAFMGIVNDYFLKYRTIAVGVVMYGVSLFVFLLLPIFEWLLERYPWRYCYYGLGLLTSINVLVSPLLKSNLRPAKASTTDHDDAGFFSMDEIHHPGQQQQVDERQHSNGVNGTSAATENTSSSSSSILSTIGTILKAPAFYMLCYQGLCQYWFYSIYNLVLFDYSADRGFTKEQANLLLSMQSVGEIVGGLGLALLIDVQVYWSSRHVIILVYFLLATCFCLVSVVTNFVWMSGLTAAIMALIAVQGILINGLVVDHFGDRKVTLCYGMITFASGVLLMFRPAAIGYFRDTLGSYDLLMASMGFMCVIGGLAWVAEPLISRCCSCRHRASVQSQRRDCEEGSARKEIC